MLREAAIAVVGFSCIVAVFGGRSRVWSPVDSFRVVNLLATATAAALFAFLPFALQNILVSDAGIWGGSSFALSAYIIGQLSWTLTNGRRLKRTHPDETQAWLAVVGTSAAAAALALQLLNLAGLGFSLELGPFLAGLVLLFLISLLQFCAIVFAGLLHGPAT